MSTTDEKEGRPVYDVVTKLKEYRARKGLTLDALGQSVGLTRAQIWRIENGARRPSIEAALALAEVTGIGKFHFRPDVWPPPKRQD